MTFTASNFNELPDNLVVLTLSGKHIRLGGGGHSGHRVGLELINQLCEDKATIISSVTIPGLWDCADGRSLVSLFHAARQTSQKVMGDMTR